MELRSVFVLIAVVVHGSPWALLPWVPLPRGEGTSSYASRSLMSLINPHLDGPRRHADSSMPVRPRFGCSSSKSDAVRDSLSNLWAP